MAHRVDGTSSVDVDPDLRWRRDSTSDVGSQQGTVAHCREGSGGQEHINEIGFSLEPSASEVLGGVALRVLTSLLRENTSRAPALNTDCILRCSVPDTLTSTEQL